MQKVTRAAALLLVALAVVLAIVAFSLSRRATQPGSGPTRVSPATADDSGGRAGRRATHPRRAPGAIISPDATMARAAMGTSR